MLIRFFYMLREGGLKTSVTELLTLLEAMQQGLAGTSVDQFYYLSRSCMVKDETQFDRFDQVFAAHFTGSEAAVAVLTAHVPDDWLHHLADLILSEEERAKIESLGGFDELMEALKERLREQDERHDTAAEPAGYGLAHNRLPDNREGLLVLRCRGRTRDRDLHHVYAGG